jgi:hypothetical protein
MLTRAVKEARPLAGPAVLILVATVLSLTWIPATFRGWSIGPALVAFHLGAAFLSALPFGMEFHQRTMVLLLSQPVTRSRVWLHKWIVLAAVLAVLAGLQFAALQAGPLADRTTGRELRFLAFLLAVLCSGTLWTLVAGSTIGGVAFMLAAMMVLEMAANLAVFYLFGASVDLFSSHPFVIGTRAAYLLAALWLGWRMFARFEVKAEGTAGTPVPSLSPGVLRCRPQGAFGNLLRKELRLQAPTLQIAAVFAVCWLLAAGYFAVTPPNPMTADVVFTVMLTVYFPLALVVAATISIGEDTALGIRAWHVTLPVSSRVQWLVKLAVAAAVAAVAAIALPVALAALASMAVPLPAGRIQLPGSPAFLVLSAGVLALGFWAAALFGHTVRAAVATGVAVLALGFCAMVGVEAGQRVEFWSRALTWLMVRNQWTPDQFFVVPPGAFGRLAIPLFVSVVAVVALAQSLRAFRRAQVDRRAVATCSVQLALISFLVTFGVTSYARAAGEQWRSAPVRELMAAIETARPSAGEPGVIPVAELQATGLLSDATSRWLSGSEITIAPRTILWRNAAGVPAAPRIAYRVRVTFPNGREYDTGFFQGDSRRR